MRRAMKWATAALLLLVLRSLTADAQTVKPQFDCSTYTTSGITNMIDFENPGLAPPYDTGQYYLKTQGIYLPGDFGSAPNGKIQNLYLQVLGAKYVKDTLPYPQHLQIKLGYTEMTAFPNAAARNGRPDTFLTSLTRVVDKYTSVWPKNLKYLQDGDWVKIPVDDSSFKFFPSRNMVIEVNCRTKPARHLLRGMTTKKSFRLGNAIYAVYNDVGVLVADTARIGNGAYSSKFAIGFDIIPTGVSELSNIRGLGLFPNPASGGRFHLSLDAKQPIKEVCVRVMDVTGRELQSRQFSNPGKSFFEEMNLSGAAPGMYFVRITADGEVFSRRVVLE